MNATSFPRLVIAFLVAVLAVTIWGAFVQTQYNLSALAGIGAEVDIALRLGTATRDVFSGFTPTYATHIVIPALLVAFLLAEWLARRAGGSRALWYTLGGALGMLAAIPLVNWLAPVALLVGASRDVSCTVVMALGGAIGGGLFVWLYFRRRVAPVVAY